MTARFCHEAWAFIRAKDTNHGHKVAASKGNPDYLFETQAGKRAAHKPDALK